MNADGTQISLLYLCGSAPRASARASAAFVVLVVVRLHGLLFAAELAHVKVVVGAFAGEEFVVGSSFDDLAGL